MSSQRFHAIDLMFTGDLQEVAAGVFLLPGFGNATIILGEDGIAVIDPGMFGNGPRVVREIRKQSDAPIRFVVYTHGHYDHAFGTPAILDDAAQRGHAAPTIIGHANVAKRFARYRKTAGHIAESYAMQFASWTRDRVLGEKTPASVVHDAIYCPPTLEYEDRIAVSLGDLTLVCRHGLGETDDHTWVWIPERDVVVAGDFIVSSMPNAGTPFRVQRYVIEWAEALEEMAGLEPAAVISGHGRVFQHQQAEEMLLTTARALRFLEDEVVRRLNAGQWHEEILHAVTLPPDLEASPYLQPLYGCTRFVVHSILRRYAGWYDGNATNLFPSTSERIAREVVSLVGEADTILQRARELKDTGDIDNIQLALHLVDYVIDADTDIADVARKTKTELLEARAAVETSFVSRNILESAAAIEGSRGT